MILTLFISGNVMFRVSSIPSKLILLGGGNIYILKVAIRLLFIPRRTFLWDGVWEGEGK